MRASHFHSMAESRKDSDSLTEGQKVGMELSQEMKSMSDNTSALAKELLERFTLSPGWYPGSDFDSVTAQLYRNNLSQLGKDINEADKMTSNMTKGIPSPMLVKGRHHNITNLQPVINLSRPASALHRLGDESSEPPIQYRGPERQENSAGTRSNKGPNQRQ